MKTASKAVTAAKNDRPGKGTRKASEKPIVIKVKLEPHEGRELRKFAKLGGITPPTVAGIFIGATLERHAAETQAEALWRPLMKRPKGETQEAEKQRMQAAMHARFPSGHAPIPEAMEFMRLFERGGR